MGRSLQVSLLGTSRLQVTMDSRLSWLLLGLLVILAVVLAEGEEEQEAIQEAGRSGVVRREAGAGGRREEKRKNRPSKKNGGKAKNRKKPRKQKNNVKTKSKRNKSSKKNNPQRNKGNGEKAKKRKKQKKQKKQTKKSSKKKRNRQAKKTKKGENGKNTRSRRRRRKQSKQECKKNDKNCEKRNKSKSRKKVGKVGKKKKNRKMKCKKNDRTCRRLNRKNVRKTKKAGNKQGKKSQKQKLLKKSKRKENKKKKSMPVVRQVTGNCTKCVELFVLYARLNDKKANSVQKQVKRIRGNDKIQGSKKGKKGDFNETYGRLLSALGGNASNPLCDGKPFNATTASNSSASNRTRTLVRSAQDSLATLEKCMANIEESCGAPLTGNSTLNDTLNACLKLADDFKSAFSKCFSADLTPDAACKCVEAIDEADVKKLQKCDTSKDNENALKLKKKCKKAVGDCKTAQGNSVEGIDLCKERTKCGGAKDKTEAEEILKKLGPLQKALQNPAFDNAMKELGLDKGAGADGVLPASRHLHQSRINKREDGAGCTAVDAEWYKFNQTASKALPSSDADVDEEATKETTGILDGINGRATLKDDLSSCGKETRMDENGRQVTVSFTIIRIRFYVFWCGWFRSFVVEIKITIITVTFGLTNPNPETTTPGTSGRNRQNLLNNIRKRAALGKL